MKSAWNENNRLRIIVLGYIVRGPIGGLAWHHMQYVMGLSALGHDVTFLEDSDDYPSCYDPSRHITDIDPAYGLKFTQNIFMRIGMQDNWAYYNAHMSEWLGPARNKINEFVKSADMIINISGVNPLRPWFQDIPVRVMIDTDPAFTQIRNLTDGNFKKISQMHTHFFSFGENFGNNDCLIPNDGFDWKPTRQPIFLNAWQVTPGVSNGKFTTVMQWDSYQSREYNGRYFGMKSISLDLFMDLPRKAKAQFELAIGSASAPRKVLIENGWEIVDPLETTRDPWTYQKYIQGSKGEFTVAKQGYVFSKSGWFSERSAAYLASGRPVIMQDTGFPSHIPCRRGLFSMKSIDDVLAALEEIDSNYIQHCKWAREIAEKYFDSSIVLMNLLQSVIS